jgi:hypothetical protein
LTEEEIMQIATAATIKHMQTDETIQDSAALSVRDLICQQHIVRYIAAIMLTKHNECFSIPTINAKNIVNYLKIYDIKVQQNEINLWKNTSLQ